MIENATPRGRRIGLVDVVRGVPILAMIVYHSAWDLSYFGLIEADIRDSEGWALFARGIAASFLVLAGTSLVLAHGESFDQRAFLGRLALVGGAALLVSAATWLVLPRSFVFFGILHAIALGSVLALPFVRLPAFAALAAAAGAFALPALLRSDAFSAPALIWLGLGTREPVSNDFVPVFPWFGCVLLGVAFARLVDLRGLADIRLTAPVQMLAAAGRRSLAIYLLHQPVLFGVLWMAALAVQPRVEAEAAGFVGACETQCRSGAGAGAATCRSLCLCAVDELKKEGLWAAVLADRLETGQRQRFDAISRRCAEQMTPR